MKYPLVLPVLVVVCVPPAWALTAEQEAKLLPADGAEFDAFGHHVALDGDSALVSSAGDDDNGGSSGSAYVFIRSGGVWSEQAKLLPADGAEGDQFGSAVAFDGDTAVIGAYRDDDNGPQSGSAYVFVHTGGSWIQRAKLLPADGAADDRFGLGVALSEDTAVIGSILDDDNGEDSGSAYVFTRTDGVWTEQAKLLPADGTEGDSFGFGVALDGDTALIGTPWDDDNGGGSGSVYRFTRAGGVWTEQAKLLPADGEAGDVFGWTVALDGDTAVIGARDDYGDHWGSAYVFTRTGGVWTEQAKLLPADGTEGDCFAGGVSLSGDTAVIGAYGDDDNGYISGSAYVFRMYDDDVPATTYRGMAVMALLLLLASTAFLLRRRATH